VNLSFPSTDDVAALGQLSEAAAALRRQLGTVVVGQQDVVEQLLVTLFARGHALLVGVPGLAKTLLVSSVAKSLGLSFGRVQFTPDLLPADITGTDVLEEREGSGGRVQRDVRFMPGPIFRHLVLADEINRTPPKTQSALLQAMQERQVTVGGNTHSLPEPFQVFATRNPIEQEGTYPLPEAQLDRFLMEIHVGYPSESEERDIARLTTSDYSPTLSPVLDHESLTRLSALVPRLPVTDEALALAVRLTRATRPQDETATPAVRRYVRYGAGPRGSQALVLASKARAAIHGEPVVDLEDIRAVATAALRHRLVLSYRAEADGVTDEQLLRGLLESVS